MKTTSAFTGIIVGSLRRPTASVAVAIIMVLTVFGQSSLGGEPEYVELDLKVGQAVEIKGYYGDENIFVATDIELLPKPRRPKVRGEIQDIDYRHNSITLYGVPIRITEDTEFLDKGDSRTTFDDLKIGQRVYVACKFDKEGNWIARKVTSQGVKKSNKIKGTLTDVSIDGAPPDTLDISGLLILLNKKTDVNDPTGHIFPIEKKIFGDLSAASPLLLDDGRLLYDRIVVRGQYRQDLRGVRQFDLTDRWDNDQDDTQPDIRLEATGYWSETIRTQAQLRIRKRYILSNDSNSALKGQFTELYLLAKDIGGSGFALQVGRQDFDEPREWLFDEYLDAIRIYYYNLKPVVFEAAYITHSIAPLKEKARTWTDLFARVRWFRDRDNVLSAYLLTRSDSDEIRKRQPRWYGLRYYGLIRNTKASLRPWADWAIMRGEDKHRTLKAWAVDAGATATAVNIAGAPSLTVAYAIGSGDDTGSDPVDYRFRQTGYEDNVDRFGGITSVRYYGTVLDPELSNLKILTLGAGVRPIENASVELVYHSYRQHRPDRDIKGSRLSATPDGISDDIGWGLDLMVGVAHIWDRVRASWTLSWFNPGTTFEPLFVETAVQSKLNVRVGFLL